MSEYQYYEFVAVGGPISDEGLVTPGAVPAARRCLQQKLASFRERYARRPAMMRRIEEL